MLATFFQGWQKILYKEKKNPENKQHYKIIIVNVINVINN